MERTYIKRGFWHFDGRKRQKGGFLPILETLAKPLLVSAAGAIGGQVLKETRKKIREKNAIEKEAQKDINMPRNKILLQRLANPRHLQLPNGRVFFAKYKRVNRHAQAPTQVRLQERMFEKLDQGDKALDGLVQKTKERQGNRLALAST